jgi:glutamate synthase (NADPH/NADH) large chain
MGPRGRGRHAGRDRRLCERAEAAVAGGYNIIILSDRRSARTASPIPALLATAAVHHHLIRKGLRTSVGLVVESGEPREVHHFCCLAGYGAEAINPYLAFDTLLDMHKRGELPEGGRRLRSREALHQVDRQGHAQGDVQDGHLDLPVLLRRADLRRRRPEDRFRREVLHRHRDSRSKASAWPRSPRRPCAATRRLRRLDPDLRNSLDVGGEYAYPHARRGACLVAGAVACCSMPCAAMRRTFKAYSPDLVNETASASDHSRPVQDQAGRATGRKPVPLDEVESAADIVKRFSTGAMSFGSISREAHETLAIAMNRIGGKSNTGEGGEEPDRLCRCPERRARRSSRSPRAASASRAEYLVNADDDADQDGAGRQARRRRPAARPQGRRDHRPVRHSTPGVGLISPPPHHDIYSIEDLAQLIYDLKNVNPAADVSVKLVSESASARLRPASPRRAPTTSPSPGYDGGTGASPLTSLKHAGSPVGNRPRRDPADAGAERLRAASRCRSMAARTGRDVVIGALLGADEFGFATAPLIAAGCIMMRKCHLNTCPVGVATQDPVLRKRFKGKPEHVINFFFFLAEEVREILAELGFRSIDEIIGHADCSTSARLISTGRPRASTSPIFHKPDDGPAADPHDRRQNHPIDTCSTAS